MKNEIKEVTKNLLSTNNIEDLQKNKEDMLLIFEKNQSADNFFFGPLIQIISEDYSKLLEKLQNNQDTDIENEKLRIVFILSAVLNLL